MSNAIAVRQAEQKAKAVLYYADIPVLKHAAAFAGVDEKTIHRWREDDPEFASQLQEAKSTFVRKYGKKARPEFMLERLDPEHFRETKVIEVVNPIQMMIKKFGLDVIEGEIDDGQDAGDVQRASSEDA